MGMLEVRFMSDELDEGLRTVRMCLTEAKQKPERTANDVADAIECFIRGPYGTHTKMTKENARAISRIEGAMFGDPSKPPTAPENVYALVETQKRLHAQADLVCKVAPLLKWGGGVLAACVMALVQQLGSAKGWW